MPIEPYLNFEGRCEEAIEFYKKALGAEVVMLMRYKDSPEPPPPGHETPGDKIMHSTLRIGDPVDPLGSSCRARVQGLERRRTSGNASHRNIFCEALRDAHRPLRRSLDDHRWQELNDQTCIVSF